MTTDELSAPLGRKPVRKRKFRLPFSATQTLATGFLLFLGAFGYYALFTENPLGGEPVARLTIQPDQLAAPTAAPESKDQDKDKGKAAAASEAAKTPPADPAGQRTVTIIDGSSGARKQVVVPSEAPEDKASAEQAPSGAVNPKLLEQTRHGAVPIAADGLKPFTAYAGASEVDRERVAHVPTIAVVVGGLGVGAAKTNDAIMKLPAAVTLAFTPYGADAAKLVERARAQRHEVLLQVPMEPFEYPDSDPGPQTLLTSVSAEQNLDRLYWHLSRFQGYVGIMNFMGARFVTTDTALSPVMREAAKRGLGYLDDGTSPRSVAAALAAGQTVPYGKADVSIDAVPTALEIDRALGRLEALARENGNAIGTASALPISIERISQWAKTLQNRGLALVPLTTAMLKSKSG